MISDRIPEMPTGVHCRAYPIPSQDSSEHPHLRRGNVKVFYRQEYFQGERLHHGAIYVTYHAIFLGEHKKARGLPEAFSIVFYKRVVGFCLVDMVWDTHIISCPEIDLDEAL